MKESREEFLDIVEDITSLIRENAVKRLKLNTFEEIQTNKKKFISEVHKDFHKAQLKICEGLINKEKELKKLQYELKSVRRKKKSNTIANINSEIRINNFRQLVYRKLADSIAWQIIKGQHYIARRLFIHQLPPKITSSNINDIITLVNELNIKDDQSFALISDLTSFIQIGDIIQNTPKGIYLIEVKEGEKNKFARELLDNLNLPDEIDYDQIFPDCFDTKMKEQVIRMHKQDIRAKRAKEVINKGVGKDPISGRNTFINEVNSELDYYYDVIERLIKESESKDWAYDVVDECLHIGAYRNNWLAYGPFALEYIIKETTGKVVKPISLLNNINIQITEPIFLKPFNKKTLRDILSGEVMVYMSLDYEQVIRKFKALGVIAKWSSRKETHQLMNGDPNKQELIRIDNQALNISNDKASFHLGSGFFVRIVSDNLKPNNAINLFTEMLNISGIPKGSAE